MKWLKGIAITAVLALALYGASRLMPEAAETPNVYYATSFTTTPYGVVGFPSFNARTGRDFVDGGVNAVQQTTGGTLVLPDDASASNPVPAMVILHGSGGDWTGRSVNLAMFLARHGIAGLAVDTFVARNLRSTDDYLERLDKAPIYTQMADALSALKALQDHPAIDKSRIGVTGFSLGAASTLYMMFEPVTENVLGKDGPRFSAYAMFYGGCRVDFDDFRVEGSPLLIMMGGADESMSVDGCEKLRERLQKAGVDVELKVYPTAGHGWDNPYPQAFKPGEWVTRDCVMKWTKSGANKEMTSGYSMDTAFGAFMALTQCASRDGYTMGYNKDAAERSLQDLLSFLVRTWNLDEPKNVRLATYTSKN
jgi:dienelactone hydrolase